MKMTYWLRVLNSFTFLLVSMFFIEILVTTASAQSVADAMDNTPGAYWNRDSCKGFRTWFNRPFSDYKKFTREDALRTTKEVQTKTPNWKKYLPCCPEKISEARSRDWELSNEYLDQDIEESLGFGLLECFHLNAVNCIRSKKYSGGDRPGQQCCYNSRGDLITKGLGAGTPDYFAPGSSNKLHEKFDVWTWTKLSHNEYQSVWTPNQGCSSPFRVVVEGNIDWTYTYLWVKKGDTVRFSDAKGTVTWGANGSSSGPNGSKIVAESAIGFTLAPPKMLDAPTGSLIGMIYFGDIPAKGEFLLDEELISKPIFIGTGGDIEVLKDGLLFLGVNDGFVGNNSGNFDIEITRIR